MSLDYRYLNLDATEDDDELWDFGNQIREYPVLMARKLFPGCPEGYVAATQTLGNYAANKTAESWQL